MRYKLMLLVVVMFAAGCSKEASAPAPAPDAMPGANEPAATIETPAAALDATALIDQQVQAIKDKLSASTAASVETALDADAFTGISEKVWAKFDTHTEDGQVIRAKLYAPAPATETETFYFNQGALIFVSGEAAENAPADKYWLENGTLTKFQMADGTLVDSADPAFAEAAMRLLNAVNRIMKLAGSR